MFRIFTFLLLIISFSGFSQNQSFKGFLIDYSYQVPSGQLSDKFGNNSFVGLNLINKKESNFFYGLKAGYIFGGNIQDSTIFDNISTENGFVIDGNGTYANIILLQEGFSSHFYGGYAVHFNDKNPTGIYFSTGLGFLQHRIRIDTKNQYIPQLNNDYKKGYDQLTNGLSTNFTIDYIYYQKRKQLKIFTGVDYSLAFTKERRAYYFPDVISTNQNIKTDHIFGVHIGIIIPINRKNEEEFHYF